MSLKGELERLKQENLDLEVALGKTKKELTELSEAADDIKFPFITGEHLTFKELTERWRKDTQKLELELSKAKGKSIENKEVRIPKANTKGDVEYEYFTVASLCTAFSELRNEMEGRNAQYERMQVKCTEAREEIYWKGNKIDELSIQNKILFLALKKAYGL